MNLSSVSGKRWIFKKYDSTDVATFVENFSLSDIVAKLLSIRKKNIQNINLFLDPKIKNLLPNPMCLKDMEIAVDRTYKSIKQSDCLGIFGDYDVDGASSTAILSRYFLSINQKVVTYIPDRQTEGYGPSEKGFDTLMKLDAKLLFTVDCGTVSLDPIKHAPNKGIDILVFDHHQSG